LLKVVEYKDGSIQIEEANGYVYAIAERQNDKLIILDPRLDPNISEVEKKVLRSRTALTIRNRSAFEGTRV